VDGLQELAAFLLVVEAGAVRVRGALTRWTLPASWGETVGKRED
jgi:hypothetical protein